MATSQVPVTAEMMDDFAVGSEGGFLVPARLRSSFGQVEALIRQRWYWTAWGFAGMEIAMHGMETEVRILECGPLRDGSQPRAADHECPACDCIEWWE